MVVRALHANNSNNILKRWMNGRAEQTAPRTVRPCLLQLTPFVLVMAFLWTEQSLASTSASLSVASVQGSEKYNGTITSVDLVHEDNYLQPGEMGWVSGLSLSVSKDPSSTSQSIGVDQGIGNGVAFGLSLSSTKGKSLGEEPKSFENSRIAFRSSVWVRENTLRISLDGSLQKTNKEERDFLDTDGRRIKVASDASGKTATLRLTHLTTPTTILMGNVSSTSTSARPTAQSGGVEGRQYITMLKSAIHGAYDIYQDVGEIDTTTDFGQVSAQTQTLRYHQRIPFDMILSSISRWHQEKEIPRSEASYVVYSNHFSQTLGLRWRYVQGSWTNDASEVGVFGTYFNRVQTVDEASEIETVKSVGLQLKVAI